LLIPAQLFSGLLCGMNTYPDQEGSADGQDGPRIVISGLDDQGQGAASAQGGNISPTDGAVQRLQNQKERGEPEDEDG
jgi:hypothetical protein